MGREEAFTSEDSAPSMKSDESDREWSWSANVSLPSCTQLLSFFECTLISEIAGSREVTFGVVRSPEAPEHRGRGRTYGVRVR